MREIIEAVIIPLVLVICVALLSISLIFIDDDPLPTELYKVELKK